MLSRSNRISAALLIATTLYGFAHFSSLPETAAIHFDIHGNPNGYASKWVVLFLIPVMTIVLTVFQSWLVKVQPDSPKKDRALRMIPRLNLIMTAIMCAAQLAIISANLPKK